MISAALFWPMPWMYCSAISTRLLVGMLTPAIRATYVSPVADPLSNRTLSSCYLGQVSANANTTPSPHAHLGPGVVIKLSDLDAALINGWNGLSSTDSRL